MSLLRYVRPETAVQVLAFALETALVCSLAIWAMDSFPAVGAAAAVAAGAVVIVFWARYLSPRSRRSLRQRARTLTAGGLFVLGGLALAVAGHGVWAVMMVIGALAYATLELKLSAAPHEAPTQTSPEPTLRRSMRR